MFLFSIDSSCIVFYTKHTMLLYRENNLGDLGHAHYVVCLCKQRFKTLWIWWNPPANPFPCAILNLWCNR